MSAAQPIIALLGQPNSGKSTLFNGLTGSRQKVGNWPGKTVEQKEGTFSHDGVSYTVVDLPGSYSLSANSDEEIVTRDYIASGKADLVCILADASQLERSLYMLADYAGIHTPAILLLNMVDVAKDQGKSINTKRIEKALGIPVLPFIAANTKEYETFFSTLKQAIGHSQYLNTDSIQSMYQELGGKSFETLSRIIPSKGIDQYTSMWLTVKIIEGDQPVTDKVRAIIPSNQKAEFENIVTSIHNGSLITGDCKFRWIDQVLKGSVNKPDNRNTTLSKFDNLATSRRWGKMIAIGITILGLVLSMIVAAPIMAISSVIPSVLGPLLTNTLTTLGASPFIISLVCSGLLNALYMTVSMVGFVFGITLVFGLIEEIGYMARISFVFDNAMSKLGLQGKAIMPFLVSVGCTIGGVAGTRVIDSWGQRLLTITLAWAVPCAATFVVIPTIASAFFGWGSIFVMIAIFGIMVIHMLITAKIFAKKFSPVSERTGMIMELPPYHKPKWGALLRYVINRVWGIFIRAFRIILVMTIIFWALSYSSDGDVKNSLLYVFGSAIEPVTRIFGMGWQTFMAFVCSAISKEAVLGVLSALFVNSGSIFDSTLGGVAAAPNLGEILTSVISKPEALAFIFATTFNIPCVSALASTYQETHSLKWTAIIAGYYTVMALVLSFIMYHFGLLIF